MARHTKHGRYTPPDIHPSAIVCTSAQIDTTGLVVIRKGTGISHGVVLYTHEHPYQHSRRPVQEITEIRLCPIEIEEDVFIGEQAMILPQVSRIHRGCLIGARAVLTKNTTGPFEIWAGNPARKIGVRKPDGAGKSG
jgi:serine O-acetyltransferase